MLKQFRIVAGLVIASIVIAFSFTATVVNASPSAEETRLYKLVNEYRAENGLSAIQFSSSLTYVAQTHVRDLQNYPPSGNCNTHSWSSNGTWSSCCYTPDHAQAQCMWDKPRELTSYPGNGYENAHGGSGGYQATATSALEGWKRSSAHNAVILNQGTWHKRPWKALGVGIYKGYAVLWFGEESDPAGTVNPSSSTGNTSTLQTKSDALFNQAEWLYPEYFLPKTATQIMQGDEGIVYYRVYDNWYASALATYLGGLWYSFYNEWHYFGTLEYANQQLCNNQC